jgi:hypothetical protein
VAEVDHRFEANGAGRALERVHRAPHFEELRRIARRLERYQRPVDGRQMLLGLGSEHRAQLDLQLGLQRRAAHRALGRSLRRIRAACRGPRPGGGIAHQL